MLSDIIYRGHALRIVVGITILVLSLAGSAYAATLTVNASGGADYTKIQDAINNSNNGDTILVYSGTYFENVNVNKQLILKGVDTGGGKPVINANGRGNAIQLSAGDSTLEGFTATGASYTYKAGIVVNSNNNVIRNNDALYNFWGIYLSYSSNNTLSGNSASGNSIYGIYLDSSSNNMLSGNSASYNSAEGISLAYSSNNMLIGNSASGNSNYGIVLFGSSKNTLNNNSASNNYYSNNYYYGIWLYSSNDNTLNNNSVSNSFHAGIYLSDSSNNMLSNNNALNNNYGISLGWYSNNNTLSGNNASNNNNGIILENSSSNTIYNNFFNNINNSIITNSSNRWNITKINGINIVGSPYLGGNFWANPNGSGFSQNCSDSDNDGICDSPYTLDSNDIDYLPLSMNLTRDLKPPASITNLKNISYAPAYINWTWTDPKDSDFAKVMVYLDGKFKTNVSKGKRFYNATVLLPNTVHTISTHTVDTSGNINKTWVNYTARTKPDAMPPKSITNLTNRSYAPNYIRWTWTDPTDYDFSKVMVYINGIFKTNVSKGIKYYNATGLTSNTSYRIGTHTVDTSGNINKTWVNHTARTTKDTVPLTRPKIILAFDDGWTSQYYKAFPIMQANHQNGTAFIITGEVAGASGQPGMEYMNLSQLKALYNAGWDLSSHTVTHPDLTTLTSTALNNELSTSKNWLNNSGFTKASRFLAYPYGAYNTTVISALQANGYLAARTVKPDPSYPQFTLSSPSIYELPTLIVQGVPGYGNPATPPAYIQNEINNTIANNGLLIITFSNIEDICCVSGVNAPEEYKTSDFKIISDFLKSKENVGQLDVVTMSEYFGTSI